MLSQPNHSLVRAQSSSAARAAGWCHRLALSIIGAAATWNRGPAFGPHWYALALVVTALPTAWVGGKLHLMQLRARGNDKPGQEVRP